MSPSTCFRETQINGVPWIYADAEAEWYAWQSRVAAFESETEAQLSRLEESISQGGHSAPTRLRLERLRSGRILLRNQVRSLLKAFYPLPEHYRLDLHLRSNTSGRQSLLGYGENILRDWAPWTKDENQASLELLQSLIPDTELAAVLVAGAGAGRVAYDLHQSFRVTSTTALDHNPLLLQIGKLMASGASLDWPSFPVNPRSSESCGAVTPLRAPCGAREGLAFVQANILESSPDRASNDLVVTPWLIDILPEPFRDFSKRVNPLVKPGGLWINFGPLAFEHRDPSHCVGPEEIPEILATAGFEVESAGTRVIPYLDSPHHAQTRKEEVFWFRAKKTKEVSPPPPHSTHPAWILDPSRPVPLAARILETAQKSAIFSNVCAQVDGTRSLQQLARNLTETYGLPEPMALEAVRKFFLDLNL